MAGCTEKPATHSVVTVVAVSPATDVTVNLNWYTPATSAVTVADAVSAWSMVPGKEPTLVHRYDRGRPALLTSYDPVPFRTTLWFTTELRRPPASATGGNAPEATGTLRLLVSPE